MNMDFDLKNKTVVGPCYNIPFLAKTAFLYGNCPQLVKTYSPQIAFPAYTYYLYACICTFWNQWKFSSSIYPSRHTFKLLRHTHFFQVTMLRGEIDSQASGETKTNIYFGQINHRICLLKRILIRLSVICSHGLLVPVCRFPAFSLKRSKHLILSICVFT